MESVQQCSSTISPNSVIKSTLNNKTFFTDQNGYFDFGFPEGVHSFIINNLDTTQITFYPHQEQSLNIYINNELISGDINGDEILNVLDIVLMINMVLANEYSMVADVNADGIVNILDVVIMVNILVGGLP